MSAVRRVVLAAVLAALSLVPAAAGATQQEIAIPPNDGWVTDLAGLLTPDEERALEARMESYRRGTTHQIALLTVPTLNGRPIERFALEVARAWGIGGADANDGALLVVAQEERELRIEVGRGLEGNLTDSISGRIIRDVIVPELRKGEFAAGIEAGIAAMHAAIGGDYGALPPEREAPDSSLAGLGVVLALVIFVALMSRRSRRYRSRRLFGRGLAGLPPVFFPHMGGGGGTGGFGGFGGFPRGGGGGGGFGGGGFGGFGGGGGFSGGGASGRW